MSDFSYKIGKSAVLAGIVAGAVALSAPAHAETVLAAPNSDKDFKLDGNVSEWSGISGINVPLKGNGKVDSAEVKAAVKGDMFYMYAKWADPAKAGMHKQYKWDEGSQSYKRTKTAEDRFAITLEMSGNFSPSKLSGQAYTADVWHWKSSRSEPAGVAHDKVWKVDTKPFPKGKPFKTSDGKTIYLSRKSDKGSRLYKSTKYDSKQHDIMPRYKVNLNPTGSIADVKTKAVWRDGYWHLEIARKLNTGNADDAVIPSNGSIKIAIAAFDSVGGRNHSTSDLIVLKTGM